MNINMNLKGTAPIFTSALNTPKSKEEKTAEENLLLEQQKAAEADSERLKKQQEEQKKLQRQNEIDMLTEQLESSKEQADNTAKEFSAIGKCLTIANRIMRGDIVPQKDIKFLMEHEQDLYKQAVLMRQPSKDPKKWDSVLEDDDEPDGGSEALPEADTGSDISADSLTAALSEGGDIG